MSDDLQRLRDLLVDRATDGLDPAEMAEVSAVQDESYDEAAAALERALFSDDEPLPEGLAARLEADAWRVLGLDEQRGSASSGPPAQAAGPADPGPAVQPVSRPVPAAPEPPAAPAAGSEAPRPGRNPSLVTLWWAVAASLLALLGWLPTAQQADGPTTLDGAGLVALADTLRLDWAATESDPAAGGASGEVLWNNPLQQGVMRFTGLALNDPSVEQYQLWIFDAERDDRYPVDGGVFNVTGETVEVPIKARLDVDRPVLFAVTVERPGGVVVSDRERIVMAAAVEG